MEQVISNERILIRYTHPTKFEEAPYGTLWKEMNSSGGYTLFIQMGKDTVNWVGIGVFLEMVFKNSLLEPRFIDHCLEVYERNGKAWVFDNLQVGQ